MALFALIVENNGFMFRLPTNTLEQPRHGSNCCGVGDWGGWSIDITTEREQGDTTTEGKHNKEVAISGSQFLNCEAKISLFEEP